jgi:thioredoxin reductase (NADPH)
LETPLEKSGFEMAHDTYDVVIIGGGPGGLTAGIYASREGLDTLLLESGLCGGLAASTAWIENYPGFPGGINGRDLMEKFKEQAQKFGAQVAEFNEVTEVEPLEKRVRIKTDNGEYHARSLIIASGSVPKKLNVPGEDEFYGKGVSYCATCDGPLHKGRDVAVIGCGNSGLQEGEALLSHVKSITFVEFLPYMNAEKILQERLQRNERTEFLLNHMLTSINGENFVNSVTVKNRQTDEEKELEVSGVFIYVGFLPGSKFLEGIVELDASGYVISDENMQTSVPGIYVAGDVRSKKVRQIDVACGEGTVAAISARDYIREL